MNHSRFPTHTLPLLLLATTLACTPPETGVFVPTPPTLVQGRPNTAPEHGPAPCQDDSNCVSNQVCCSGLCLEESRCASLQCTRQGESCVVPPDQAAIYNGDFVCARIASGQTFGTCLRTCEAAITVGTCAPNTYCLNITVEEESDYACIPGECRTDDDCAQRSENGGTCIPFGNDAGFCFTAGTLTQGSLCGASAPEARDQCGQGLYCTRPVGSQESTCQPLCDFWAREDTCPSGMSCSFLTRGMGVCNTQTQQGRNAFEPCDPSSAWCNDGMQCLDLGLSGESLPLCTPYCRPFAPGDCQGAGFEREASCRTVFSDGNGQPLQDLGLCF